MWHQRKCAYIRRWLKDGSLLDEPSRGSQLVEPRWCRMVGCNSERANQYDDRYPYCSVHQQLTRSQRSREAKRRRARGLEEFTQRYLLRPFAVPGLPTSIADFVRHHLRGRRWSVARFEREARLDGAAVQGLLAAQGRCQRETLTRALQALGLTLADLHAAIGGGPGDSAAHRAEDRDPLMPRAKPCARCKESKPLTEFGLNPRMRSGRNSYCRACSNEYLRLRRANARLMKAS